MAEVVLQNCLLLSRLLAPAEAPAPMAEAGGEKPLTQDTFLLPFVAADSLLIRNFRPLIRP